MMNQFEVLTLGGRRFLCIIQTERYDFMIGFRRIVEELV